MCYVAFKVLDLFFCEEPFDDLARRAHISYIVDRFTGRDRNTEAGSPSTPTFPTAIIQRDRMDRVHTQWFGKCRAVSVVSV
jgi:hypothetical protein